MAERYRLTSAIRPYRVLLGARVRAQSSYRASFGLDLLSGMPEARALLSRLASNPNVQRVAAEREADWPRFMARVQAVARAAG